MGDRILRSVAGLLAAVLVAAFLAAVLGFLPRLDALVYFAYFFCDAIPLAWIALHGRNGRKSRLMLWGLAIHALVGAAQIAVNDWLLVLPLQFLWMVYYLAVVASDQLRDLLPGARHRGRQPES